MRTSEKTDQLDEALAKAQGELKNPEKTKTAKVKGTSKAGKDFEYSYNYADIADGVDIARPVLSKHGIAVIQGTRIEGGCVILETRLSHKGEWIESDYPVGKADQPHQDLGGAMTYARRYSLFPMLGIAAEEDKDGQHVSGAAPETQEEQKLNSAAKWQADQITNLNHMESGDKQAFDNWITTSGPTRGKLRAEHPGLSKPLEEVISNTAKRVGAEDFDGCSD